MTFDLNFPSPFEFEPVRAVFKQSPEDFVVEELFQPALAGEGEHQWLWLEKIGQNTEYVAKQLARAAGVREMDVGFSGLKDRHAVTRQWFSIYLGNKQAPNWDQIEIEGVKILSHARHVKKLRRGEHEGNHFEICLRELGATEKLDDVLKQIQLHGFPNYFGIQRFGHDGANLVRGERYFAGEIKASRSQRGFYISAARSYLFNLCLAKAIEDGSWKNEDAAGPLFGDPVEGVEAVSASEQALFDAYPLLCQGLHKNRLKLERRPFAIVPGNFTWAIDGKQISLSFDLPSGVFATALLDSIFQLESV